MTPSRTAEPLLLRSRVLGPDDDSDYPSGHEVKAKP